MRMTTKRVLAYLFFVIIAGSLMVLFFDGLRNSQSIAGGSCLSLAPQNDQRPAPKFDLMGLDGKKHSLSSYRGKTVLIHFWATWCSTCLEELPSLYRMVDAIKSDKFKFLALSVDDNLDTVKAFFKKHQVPPLPTLHDKDAKIASAFGTSKFPESYLINPEGKIVYRFVNKRNWSSPQALMCLRSQLK